MHEMHWQKQSKSAIHEVVSVKHACMFLAYWLKERGLKCIGKSNKNQHKQNNQFN